MDLRSLALAAAAALSLAATQAAAETVLKFSSFLPTTHALCPVWQKWQADVERVTEGRVRIEILPKVVGTVAGQLDVARDGLADIACIIHGCSPGRFTMTSVAEPGFVAPADGSNSSCESRMVASWHEQTDAPGLQDPDGAERLCSAQAPRLSDGPAWCRHDRQVAATGKRGRRPDDRGEENEKALQRTVFPTNAQAWRIEAPLAMVTRTGDVPMARLTRDPHQD